jgi:hypothetical protein
VARSEQRGHDSLLAGSVQPRPGETELALPAPSRGQAVQRAVNIGELASEVTQAPQEEAEEPDIDELARKVYAAIKLRLAVERERLGSVG